MFQITRLFGLTGMRDGEVLAISGNPVNVCLLTETFHPVTGGGETQARVLASGLAASGATVQLITRRSDKLLPAQDSLGSVQVWRLPPVGPGQLKKWGMVLTALIALVRLRASYDVIIVCGFRILGIPAVIAARLLNKSCVLKADSLGECSGEFFKAGLKRYGLRQTNFLFRFLLGLRNRLLRRATHFVAISSAVEDELIQHDIDRNRISRIPNSVDTGIFSPVDELTKAGLREKLGVPVSGRIGIYTGRLVTTKGLPLLLSVWDKVRGRHRDAHLLLVGAGGLGIQNCELQLREFVQHKQLDQFVTFAGSVDNVHEYLQASDFFVFPTEREAFGISVIEALACALPVITTTTGGLGDIVKAEQNAVVVPVADAEALERAIERVLGLGPKMQQIAAAGRELAVSEYAELRILDRYASLLAQLSRASGKAGLPA